MFVNKLSVTQVRQAHGRVCFHSHCHRFQFLCFCLTDSVCRTDYVYTL